MMTKEERHLQTKIMMFEDMMIRSKNVFEIEQLRVEIMKMREKLQKLQWKRA